MRPNRLALLVLVVALGSGLGLHEAAGAPRAGARATLLPPAPAKSGKATDLDRTLRLVYGDDHAFGVIPPLGWVLDDTSGLGSQIRIVLYPRGQKWETSPVVMYSNPLHQDPHARKSLMQMVDQDIAAFRKNSPRGKVTPAPGLAAFGGRQAVVRYFAPNGGEPRTAVAYLEEKDMVMLLVLDARGGGEFTRSLRAFKDLVGSYQFVAAHIRTPTRPGKAG